MSSPRDGRSVYPGRAGRRSALRLLASLARPARCGGRIPAEPWVAKLGGNGVPLIDDPLALGRPDRMPIDVPDDVALPRRQQVTTRVSRVAATWHRAEVWCLPAETISRW